MENNSNTKKSVHLLHLHSLEIRKDIQPPQKKQRADNTHFTGIGDDDHDLLLLIK